MATGPVARPVGYLRRIGAGERVLKTALAAGLAWELGKLVPGAHSPYLAPLVALLVMQITIADSISAASQRLFGVIVGVLVALAILAALGVNGVTIALLVLVSLVLGSALRLGPQGVPQVAVSALLVVAVGGSSTVGFAFARIAETIIGALVGIGVNALLAPPSLLEPARDAVDAHAAALSRVLADLAAAIRQGLTAPAAASVLEEARASDAALRAAETAHQRTETAHRYNLWKRAERPLVERLGLALRTQERVAMQVRGVVRTIDESAARADPECPPWLAAGAFGGDLVRLVDTVSGMVGAFPAALQAGPGSSQARELLVRAGEALELRDAIAANPAAVASGAATQEWVQLGSVLADLDRIRRELVGAVSLPMGTAPAPPSAPTG